MVMKPELECRSFKASSENKASWKKYYIINQTYNSWTLGWSFYIWKKKEEIVWGSVLEN